MTATLAGSLFLLALLDSTSFGTLLIPIWFLLAPGRVAVGRILVFLGTVATFYFGVGLALLFGVDAMLGRVGGWLEDPMVIRGQLILGVGLFVWSFFIGKSRKGPDGQSTGSRLGRWRERALGRQGSGLGALIALALGTALIEVASMLPYLGAIGLLSTSDLGVGNRVVALAGYCVVMVLPALVALGGRIVAHRLIEPLLRRVARWLEKSAGEMTAWIVGIVGFLVARDALARLPEFSDVLKVG